MQAILRILFVLNIFGFNKTTQFQLRRNKHLNKYYLGVVIDDCTND